MRVSLKAARVNKGLRQTDVATHLNVTRGTVWRWENGKSLPTADLIEPLCQLLDVTYDDIKWKP